MMKIKIFYPLEEQPKVVDGAENWLIWRGESIAEDPLANVYETDYFADWMIDSGKNSPLGAIWVDNDGIETADRFTIKAGDIKTVFTITDYRVVCQSGVWGWEVEAEVQP
jgi:hypothetical protein